MATTEPPVTTIHPATGWVRLDFGELLANRELLYFLVWRDLKVRYKQTLFGALWAILQPIGLALVLTFALGRLSGLAPAGVPYAAYVLAGLVPWTLVSQGVLRASDSLVNSANLLQKVYFPRLLLPLAAVGLHLVDYVLALGTLLVACAVFGFVPGLSALWLIPLSALGALVALAVGVWLSAINVRFRDVRAALPFLVQVWLFASPIAYGVGIVPSWAVPIYQLNPIVGLAEGFRWALFQLEPAPIGAVLTATAVTLLMFVTGLACFARVERTFADVI
jgi:lipopolysaccharide transport system permease protein